MSYFAVIREAGPAWADGKGIAEQAGVGDHAGFMEELGRDGFVLFAGPLAGSEQGRVRALLIVTAESEAEIHGRLAHEPGWEQSTSSPRAWSRGVCSSVLSAFPRHTRCSDKQRVFRRFRLGRGPTSTARGHSLPTRQSVRP